MNNGFCIQQFELLDRWDVLVATPTNMENKEEKKYEMYATIDAFEQKYGQDEEYNTECILDVLKRVRDKEAELVIEGVLPFSINATYDDVMSLEPELSGIIALVDFMNEKMTEAEFIEAISEIPVIFLGEYPNMEKGGTFGVHTVKHVKEDYEMIPVFYSEKSAMEYNKSNHPMTRTTIKSLIHFYNTFGVIVEPQKKYWGIIKPEGK